MQEDDWSLEVRFDLDGAVTINNIRTHYQWLELKDGYYSSNASGFFGKAPDLQTLADQIGKHVLEQAIAYAKNIEAINDVPKCSFKRMINGIQDWR